MMRRILITGANSYLGTSLEAYLKRWPQEYAVDTVDMIGDSWRDKDFSGYQTVYHVAGIAHSDFGKVSKEREELYRRVNTDLAVETAAKAKAGGVRQFIFLSSMSVYGIHHGMIDSKTVPKPDSCYGRSKLQAETLINQLRDERFGVAILRPPMVYGRGCKGNYPKLTRLALKVPVFPKIENRRSMIYIDNLSAFVRQLVARELTGIFYPQNADYVNVSQMVELVCREHGKRIRMTRLFNPLIYCLHGVGTVQKVFGDLFYDQALSDFDAIEYQEKTFMQSIKLTEMEI